MPHSPSRWCNNEKKSINHKTSAAALSSALPLPTFLLLILFLLFAVMWWVGVGILFNYKPIQSPGLSCGLRKSLFLVYSYTIFVPSQSSAAIHIKLRIETAAGELIAPKNYNSSWCDLVHGSSENFTKQQLVFFCYIFCKYFYNKKSRRIHIHCCCRHCTWNSQV